MDYRLLALTWNFDCLEKLVIKNNSDYLLDTASIGQYRNERVAHYSAATIVTVTRFSARDHWASDMFIGSALGIGIGAHVFHAHCDPDLSDSCKHHVRWIF